MDELIARQLEVIKSSMADYKDKKIGLNRFIQKLEAISCVIDDESWSSQVFPIVLDLEQVNAFLIDSGGISGKNESSMIERLLDSLESAIDSYHKLNSGDS